MIVVIDEDRDGSKKHARDEDITNDHEETPVKRSRSASSAASHGNEDITPKAEPSSVSPPSSKPHRVVLIIKTGETTQSEIYIKEEVVRKIALYNKKLNKELQIDPTASTIVIRDLVIRPATAVRDLFQYLEDGTVDPGDKTNPLTLKKSWERLLNLWQIGELLGVQDLEQAVIDRLEMRKLSLGIFVDIVRVWLVLENTACYGPQSKLPREVRRVLKERLGEIVDNGFDMAIILDEDNKKFLAVFAVLLADEHRALRKKVDGNPE